MRLGTLVLWAATASAAVPVRAFVPTTSTSCRGFAYPSEVCVAAGRGVLQSGVRPRRGARTPYARRVRCLAGGGDTTVPQRVAVVGAGAVGLYYGARLLETGHDVSFLARRDLKALQKDGLTVESVDGDVRFDKVSAFGTAEELRAAASGDIDWVILSLKSYSLPMVPDLLSPLIGANTRILAIMNGLGIEDTLAKSFAPGKIFGGMAFTCNNRVEGVVKHLKYGALLVGHNGDDPAELAAVEQLFANANVKLSTSPCLLESRWEKLCWNMPFNGLACAMGGITTDRIVGDPDLRAQALAVMEEVVEMGQRDLSARALDGTGALGQPLIERMFALTDSMGPYRPSTMIDLIEGSPMEVDYIFSNPLRRAEELGAPRAHVESVIRMIRAQQRLRDL